MMVTSNGEKDQILRAIAAGVSGYVVKPFIADALDRELEEMRRKIAA